jgi:hypothetical protein
VPDSDRRGISEIGQIGNPQHYLADVLSRIADHPARRIAELPPWS